MPGLSGTELAASLASLLPGLQVVYMSGYTDGALPETGLGDTPVDVLRKPFTAEELAAAIGRLTFD